MNPWHIQPAGGVSHTFSRLGGFWCYTRGWMKMEWGTSVRVWLVLKSLTILSPYGLWGLHRQREDRDLEREAAAKRWRSSTTGSWLCAGVGYAWLNCGAAAWWSLALSMWVGAAKDRLPARSLYLLWAGRKKGGHQATGWVTPFPRVSRGTSLLSRGLRISSRLRAPVPWLRRLLSQAARLLPPFWGWTSRLSL